MAFVFGDHIVWPNSQVTHRELRRGLSMPHYNSPEFERLVDQGKQLAAKYKISMTEAMDRLCELLYDDSALGVVNESLAIYELQFPADSYRRTSLNFDIQVLTTFDVDPHVDTKTPNTVYITNGTLLAVEDASQALLAMWQEPFGLKLHEESFRASRYRKAVRGEKGTFTDYSNGVFVTDEEKKLLVRQPELKTVPIALLNNFYLLSDDADRQIMGDNLATAAMLWTVGHEDAHKYSGHLRFYRNQSMTMGAAVQPWIYSEMYAPKMSSADNSARRSAELGADFHATMRAVDVCFDNEFLAITTDHVSDLVRYLIYGGRRRSLPLEAPSRLFLLRFIAASALLPLAVYEVGSASAVGNNVDSYPPFYIRALNILFTVAQRALDVALTQEHRNLGLMEPAELRDFLETALRDLVEIYAIVLECVEPGIRNAARPLPKGLVNTGPCLLLALLAWHSPRPGAIALPQRMFEGDNAIVQEFLIARQTMFKHTLNDFAPHKREENLARSAKTEEDLARVEHFINLGKSVFSFLT